VSNAPDGNDVKNARLARRPNDRAAPSVRVASLCLGTFALGWWAGNGMGTEFSGWWNRNAGFATFLSGLLVFGATVVYVTLTHQLVRAGRRSLDAAEEANRQTREALDLDRRLYILNLKSRIDSLLPVISVRVLDVELLDLNGSSVDTMTWSAFSLGSYQLAATFEVANHGHGAGTVGLLDPPRDGVLTIVDNSRHKDWHPPTVVAAGHALRLRYELSVDGHTIESTWRGDRVLEMTFRTGSSVETEAYDEHVYWLVASVSPHANQFSRSLSLSFAQPGPQLPSQRRYPIELKRT